MKVFAFFILGFSLGAAAVHFNFPYPIPAAVAVVAGFAMQYRWEMWQKQEPVRVREDIHCFGNHPWTTLPATWIYSDADIPADWISIRLGGNRVFFCGKKCLLEWMME
jgi:hypothetical protein